MEGSEGELLSTWRIKSCTIPNGVTINAVFALQPYASSHVKPKLHEAVEVHFSAWLQLQYLVEFNTPGEDDTVVMPVKPNQMLSLYRSTALNASTGSSESRGLTNE